MHYVFHLDYIGAVQDILDHLDSYMVVHEVHMQGFLAQCVIVQNQTSYRCPPSGLWTVLL